MPQSTSIFILLSCPKPLLNMHSSSSLYESLAAASNFSIVLLLSLRRCRTISPGRRRLFLVLGISFAGVPCLSWIAAYSYRQLICSMSSYFETCYAYYTKCLFPSTYKCYRIWVYRLQENRRDGALFCWDTRGKAQNPSYGEWRLLMPKL